jgi:type VI secretion system protein ImpG
MQDPDFKRRLASLYKEVQEFASQYEHNYLGSIAENPHITRLIEAFTFLHNKLHVTLEESRDEIVSSLIGLMYPHLNQPIPSYMLVQFYPAKDQGKPICLHKGTLICVEYQNQKAKFQITYDHEIVPILITDIAYRSVERQVLEFGEAKSCMSIKLQTIGTQKFSSLGLTKLRFCINREDKTEYSVYEAMFMHLLRVVITDVTHSDIKYVLSKESITKVGFGTSETLLPKQDSVFSGYHLLTEFFFFPAKFLFFDMHLENFDSLKFSESINIDFYFDDGSLRDLISPTTILLNVAPTINLFRAESDPIEISYGKKDYQVIVDKINLKDHSVYSVEEVRVGLVSGESITARPLAEVTIAKNQVLWHADYKKSLSGDFRDCYVSLISDAQLAHHKYFCAKVQCFNHDVPYKIFATFQQKVHLFFQEENLLIGSIAPLGNPTSVRQICSQIDQKVQLLTYLSVHYLNILEEHNAKRVLQNLLSIYVQEGMPHGKILVESINQVEASPHLDKIKVRGEYFFCRGILFRVHFENIEQIPKGLLMLFCQALDEFLSFYCPINSFTKFEGWYKKQIIYEGIARQSKVC